MKISRKLLFFPALAVGVIALVLAINLRPDIPTKPAGERARLVDVQVLELKAIAPRVIGFGKVVPKFEWQAIAEVTGKVVYRNPSLEKGRVLPANTVILKIDPLDYELKLTQAESDLNASRTQLAKLEQEEKNLKQTRIIENNRLDLANKELARQQNLLKKGLTSQSGVDQQYQTTLAQRKVVQDIDNQLLLYPDEKRVSQAQVKVNQAKVEEAQRSLDKTTITLPRDLRIAQVDIEENQVVNLQQTMVTAQGMDIMEVEAQLSIHDMQTLSSSLGQFSLDDSGIPQPDMSDFTASILLRSGNLEASWPAKVTRISETVDPNQATVGVILEMEQDYTQLTPETVPPLANGMFVRAAIEGQANPSWVIPERALHGDKVYLLNNESKLTIQSVEVLFRRDNQVVIDGELQYGDKLILNDLLPAIDGMALRESALSEEQEQEL
ncbi:efflux RND transporter periplasmic adaptor subunit [Vibrio maerlii]|uniref:efflux RND transporter periplasmic adaptor subunit n=1 Tax=Vibrio maerlii TaxID=2231648 RepID=UPI000E3C3D44|nr:HlyD family secretion protein [Vibrio maerlii]